MNYDEGVYNIMWITLCLTVWLFIIGAMDIQSRCVPVWTLGFGGVLAICSLICQFAAAGSSWVDIVWGMGPGILLLLLSLVTKNAGCGDGMAMLFLGVTVGGGESWLIFGLSLFGIAGYSLVVLVLQKAGRKTRIPYLPFLAAAWLLIMGQNLPWKNPLW